MAQAVRRLAQLAHMGKLIFLGNICRLGKTCSPEGLAAASGSL